MKHPPLQQGVCVSNADTTIRPEAYYKISWRLMNFSRCVVQGSGSTWRCTRRKCVVRRQLIERVNSAAVG